MLTENELDTLRKNLERYEGKVAHMYLDSRGFVTVGVGSLLSKVGDAQKLPFLKESGEYASQEEIGSEFNAVESQEGNRVASYYQQFTALHLSNDAINDITNEHIETFYKELKVIYEGFDDFPSKAKLALFDLIFNLGMTKLRKKWPKLNACVAASDWAAAAENCRRRGISDDRNDYVKELLLTSSDQSIV